MNVYKCLDCGARIGCPDDDLVECIVCGSDDLAAVPTIDDVDQDESPLAA